MAVAQFIDSVRIVRSADVVILDLEAVPPHSYDEVEVLVTRWLRARIGGLRLESVPGSSDGLRRRRSMREKEMQRTTAALHALGVVVAALPADDGERRA